MAESTLGKALSRLFSSNVIARDMGGDELKIVDPNNVQSIGSQYQQSSYKGMHSGGGQSGYGYGGQGYGAYGYSGFDESAPGSTIGYLSSRQYLYRDYESMDTDSIISSALDMYADETVTEDEYGDVLTISSNDQEVKDILEDLFYNRLDIEFNMRWWVRSMCKYGDTYLKVEVSEEEGVLMVQPLSPYEMTRIEGEEDDPYSTKFQYDGLEDSPEFEFWEILHFRLSSDGNYLPYGKSILEGARRTWKQLMLMEDAMLVHRVMRAPERRVFKIDVGNLEPDAVDTFMSQIVQEIDKTPLVDHETGEYNLQYNMTNMIEDYYVPVRGGDTGTEINTLSGIQYNAIEDIEYLRKKMMTSLRIPNAFLGYEEELEGKATLAQQNIKFAHQIENIQKIIVSELRKVAIVHLYSLGITDQRLLDFELSLTNPSTVRESEYLDLINQKVDLARTITELPIFSTQWIYEEIFDLSDEEIKRQRELKVDDKKRKFRFEQLEREGNDPIKTGVSFGTPHDLAQSGSADIKPLALDMEEKEEDKEDAVKNMKKNRDQTVDDPLGKEKGFDSSNLRDKDPDYEKFYRQRKGLDDDFIPNTRQVINEIDRDIFEGLEGYESDYEEDTEKKDFGTLDDTFMDEDNLDV